MSKSIIPGVAFSLTFAIAAAALSLPAKADFISDVESARANARAGGPTNDRDRELLARWGATSGTPKRYERSVRHPDRPYKGPARHGRRHHR